MKWYHNINNWKLKEHSMFSCRYLTVIEMSHGCELLFIHGGDWFFILCEIHAMVAVVTHSLRFFFILKTLWGLSVNDIHIQVCSHCNWTLLNNVKTFILRRLIRLLKICNIKTLYLLISCNKQQLKYICNISWKSITWFFFVAISKYRYIYYRKL